MPKPQLLPSTLLALLLLPAFPLAAQPPSTDNPWQTGWTPSWQPIFQGVDWTGACTTRLPSQPATPGVRTERANAVRIDLTNPGIQFFSAPKPAGAGTSYDTSGARASDFLCQWGLQVAVNANFFWPCCTAEPATPPAPNQLKLCGLAEAAGQQVSELSSVPAGVDAGVEALLITGSNQASFATILQGASPAGDLHGGGGEPAAGGLGLLPADASAGADPAARERGQPEQPRDRP